MTTATTCKTRQQKIDIAWLNTAMVFGLGMSKDPECKLGACVVDAHGRMVSFGYNGLPSGVPDTEDVWGNKQIKNAIVKHAEENAISQAPFDTHGSTIYVTRKPCHHCLGTIVNAGCTRLVYMHYPQDWKYANDEAFELIRQSSELQVHIYAYFSKSIQILEVFDAVPDGVDMQAFTPPVELDLGREFPLAAYELQQRAYTGTLKESNE